jgi:hypothetical protein
MELAAATTIWICFSVFLLGPVIGAPARVHRSAMTLLCGELFALLVWSQRAPNCELTRCSDVMRTARSAAALDLPALAVAGAALTVTLAYRRAASA